MCLEHRKEELQAGLRSSFLLLLSFKTVPLYVLVFKTTPHPKPYFDL